MTARPFRRRALVDLVQTAYANTADDDAWLAELQARAHALLDAGMGSLGFFVDAPAQRISNIVGAPELAAAIGPMHAFKGATAWDIYYEPRATSLRTFYGTGGDSEVPQFLGPNAGDIWGITCVDARGRGVVLCAPQGSRRGLPLGRRAWTMTAAHIATAFRLRGRAPAPADAVLSHTGKVLHREPAIAGSEKALAEAVVRRAEALRTATSLGSEAALDVWRGLADGRWSIVEDVESDGKRYLVARVNELDTGEVGTTALTALERQVCAMAAAGHAQKLIAYELGIHASRVARYLASGMMKLGTASLADLARQFSWLPESSRKPR